MTPREQNIAIAEACPDVHSRFFGPVWTPETHGYTTDLNAMHEAEKSLKGTDNWHKYGIEIGRITRCLGPRNGAIRLNGFGYYALAHATAAQRAEAFLRTVGKWRENSSCHTP